MKKECIARYYNCHQYFLDKTHFLNCSKLGCILEISNAGLHGHKDDNMVLCDSKVSTTTVISNVVQPKLFYGLKTLLRLSQWS